jgi:hypothetical protein
LERLIAVDHLDFGDMVLLELLDRLASPSKVFGSRGNGGVVPRVGSYRMLVMLIQVPFQLLLSCGSLHGGW